MSVTRRERVERRLAAILAADIVGYSRLMGADEEGTLAALKAVRQDVTDPTIEEHRGRIVKTMGDGLLVEFGSVVDAVLCAVQIQKTMTVRNQDVAADHRIVFRIGINLGDIIIDENDIFGDGVNLAARLEALAEPGGICISQVVRDQVHGKLDVTFVDQGDRQVKNIARPVRVFRVWLSGETPAHPPGPRTPAELPFQTSSQSASSRSGNRSFPRKALDLPILSLIIFTTVAVGALSWTVGSKFRSETQENSGRVAQPDGRNDMQPGMRNVTSSPLLETPENLSAATVRAAQSTIIGDPVLFDKDNVVLSRSANAILERQAQFLRDHPAITVTVEGYCSEDEGAREGCSVLAQLRASQVRNALKERGVAGARIRIVTRSEPKPDGASAGEPTLAQNRRAVVLRD
jgi:class 3 adenylate cyclase/outer membrane protein OmpA-like peptidoglycan-associated protein